MKRTIIKGFLTVFFLGLCMQFESCRMIYKSIKHGQADITDHEWQPKVQVPKGAKSHEFVYKEDVELATFLNKNLKNTRTNGFLVIRNDTIVYEKYFNTYNENSLQTSFSVAKSFVSALVGIAQEEGLLKEYDPITKYLPELLKQDENFQKITIHHLLNMQSGIKFDEYPVINPFTGMARLYYGSNIKGKILYNMHIEEPPGRSNYRSIDTQVLGVILERVTKMPLQEYLTQKLWQPLEMESDATWSVDSEHNKMVKAFCCLNATARDFAKFGRLYLNGGKYKGKQIVPRKWVEKTSSGKKIKTHNGYKNKWWTSYHYDIFNTIKESKIYAKKHNKKWVKSKELKNGKYSVFFQGDDYNALGILGQYVYVHPKENIIVVRLGNSWQYNGFYLSEIIYTYVGNGRYKKMLEKK